jgi:hypothetical protein
LSSSIAARLNAERSCPTVAVSVPSGIGEIDMTEIEKMWTEVQPENMLYDYDVQKVAVYADDQGYVTILDKFYDEDSAVVLDADSAAEFLLLFVAALFKAQAARNKIVETFRAQLRDESLRASPTTSASVIH